MGYTDTPALDNLSYRAISFDSSATAKAMANVSSVRQPGLEVPAAWISIAPMTPIGRSLLTTQ